MLDRQTLLVLVLGVCAANGIFSPFLRLAIPIAAVLMPEMFPKSAEWVLFFSSLLLATTTLFVSGVPAALWERLFERDATAATSLWIWLAGAVILSLPALGTVVKMS
jgi:hypothetical protein